MDIKVKVMIVTGVLFLGAMFFAASLLEDEVQRPPKPRFPGQKEALEALPKPVERGPGAVPDEGDVQQWALVGGELDDSRVHAAAFSPDGKLLVGSVQDRVVWWDVASGRVLKVWKAERVVSDVRFSVDGERVHGCARGRLLTWSVKKQAVVRDVMLEPARSGTCVVSVRGDALYESSSPFKFLAAGQTEPVVVEVPKTIRRKARVKVTLDADGTLWLRGREVFRYDLEQARWDYVGSVKGVGERLVRRKARQVIVVDRRKGTVALGAMGSAVKEELAPFRGKLIKAALVGEELVLVGRKFSERRSGAKLERVEELAAPKTRNASILAVGGGGRRVAYKANPPGRFFVESLEKGQSVAVEDFIKAKTGELPKPDEPEYGDVPVWEAQHNRFLARKGRRVLALDGPGRRVLLMSPAGASTKLQVFDLQEGQSVVEAPVGVKARAAAFGGAKDDEVVTCADGALFILAADDLSLRRHIDVLTGNAKRRCMLSARGEAAAWWNKSALTLFHVGTERQRAFELPWWITGPVHFWGQTDVLVPTEGGVAHASLHTGEVRLMIPKMEVIQALPVSKQRVVLLTRPKPKLKAPRDGDPPTVVSVYDVSKGEVIHELGVFEGVRQGRLARNGALVLLRGADGLWVFETATGKAVMRQEGHRAKSGGLGLISDDGALVVEAIKDRLRLLAVATGIEWGTGEPKARYGGWVSGSRAGSRLVMHSRKGDLAFLDPKSLEPACEVTPKILALRGTMEASADGKLGAIGRGSVVELWDLESCQLVRTFPFKAVHAYPDAQKGQLRVLSAVSDDTSLYSTVALKTGRWSAGRRWSSGIALGVFWSHDLTRSLRSKGGKVFLEWLSSGKKGRSIKVPPDAIQLWSVFGDDGPTVTLLPTQEDAPIETAAYDLKGAQRWKKPWWLPLLNASPLGRYQGMLAFDPNTKEIPEAMRAALLNPQEGLGDVGEGRLVVVDVTTGEVALEVDDNKGWVLLGPQAAYQVEGERIERLPYR